LKNKFRNGRLRGGNFTMVGRLLDGWNWFFSIPGEVGPGGLTFHWVNNPIIDFFFPRPQNWGRERALKAWIRKWDGFLAGFSIS